jgi:hypothetical protein
MPAVRVGAHTYKMDAIDAIISAVRDELRELA